MTFDEMLTITMEQKIRAAYGNELSVEYVNEWIESEKEQMILTLVEAFDTHTRPPRFRADLLVRQKGE